MPKARKQAFRKLHLVIFTVFDFQFPSENYAVLTSRIMKAVPKSVKIAENAVVIPDNQFVDAECEIIGILPDGAEFLKFEIGPSVTGIYGHGIQKRLLRLGLDAYCTPASPD